MLRLWRLWITVRERQIFIWIRADRIRELDFFSGWSATFSTEFMICEGSWLFWRLKNKSARILINIGHSLIWSDNTDPKIIFPAFRYLGLSFVREGYQFLLLCTINGLTCSLFVTAYVDYIKQHFSPKIFTVVCGLAASLYNRYINFLQNTCWGGKFFIKTFDLGLGRAGWTLDHPV